jgi:methionyl aminopeptidase
MGSVPDLPGHRISDFPHAAIHTGSLAEFAMTPAAMRWILETHLVDPKRRFGAFMLLHDSYCKSPCALYSLDGS